MLGMLIIINFQADIYIFNAEFVIIAWVFIYNMFSFIYTKRNKKRNYFEYMFKKLSF